MANANPFNDWLWSQIPPFCVQLESLEIVQGNPARLLSHKALYLRQVWLPSPCHALIPVFNNLTSDRSRGGCRGDFNTKSLPLSLSARVTAYQRPLSDVGKPGPCPPNSCRPGRQFCPNQTENYRTGTARVDINEPPGSLCPLCGQEERSLDINLFFSRLYSHVFFLFPHLTTQAIDLVSPSHYSQIKWSVSSDSCCNCNCSWTKRPLKH